MKTLTQLRASFWASHSQFKAEHRKTWKQSQYGATIRSSFVEFVDSLEKDGIISENLANRATL
jgi:hypothetical protein